MKEYTRYLPVSGKLGAKTLAWCVILAKETNVFPDSLDRVPKIKLIHCNKRKFKDCFNLLLIVILGFSVEKEPIESAASTNEERTCTDVKQP